MEMHLLAASVSKSFDGDTWVLNGLDLEVKRGQMVFLVGGSGSGKTTLLRLLAGLDQPTKGQIELSGESLSGRKESELLRLRRKIGVVFQTAALFDDMTVWENLGLPLREHGSIGGEDIDERISTHLRELGLDGSEDKLPAELSGGMKKRVGLGRALMLQPELILYDEPVGGLDPATARKVERLMGRICRDDGVTSVVVSHDMASALRLADRVCVLDGGKFVLQGAPEEILDTEPFAGLVRDSGVDARALLRQRENDSGTARAV